MKYKFLEELDYLSEQLTFLYNLSTLYLSQPLPLSVLSSQGSNPRRIPLGGDVQVWLWHRCLLTWEPCLQVGVGKKAEAVATVVAAVDQARVREPREPTHTEESFTQQTTLEYGYKEHISATKVPEQPQRPASEPHIHVVPKAVKPVVIQAPSETHIKTTDQMGMHISSQVRPLPHFTAWGEAATWAVGTWWTVTSSSFISCRSRKLQMYQPKDWSMWINAPAQQALTLPFQKLLSLRQNTDMR